MTPVAVCRTTTFACPSALTSTLTVYVQPWLITCARILGVAHTASVSSDMRQLPSRRILLRGRAHLFSYDSLLSKHVVGSTPRDT